MIPSPFEVGQAVGNQSARGFRAAKDESAIDSILGQAMDSQDPEVLEKSISNILGQVSPERQGPALQFIQNRMQNVQSRKEKAQQAQAAQRGGYDPFAPPQVQAQQVKDASKAKRIADSPFGNILQPQSNVQPNTSTQQQSGEEIFEDDQIRTQTTPTSRVRELTDDQLVLGRGHPDKEVQNMSQAEQERRESERKLEESKRKTKEDRSYKFADKVLESAMSRAESLPMKKTARATLKDQVLSKDLSFWSKDNLAEITGVEGFRSPQGAVFKTAGKEYLLGNISRAGARPNQWIEQQIADMLAKVGRSTAANLSVVRALENENTLDEEHIQAANRIYDEVEQSGGDMRTVPKRLNDHMLEFAENSQKVLQNDLRAYAAIEEGKPVKLIKVPNGTPITKEVAEALVMKFNKDPMKARNEAKKLGYNVE